MLPGIRFLLAAILLSMSILIFGLGAAALLRAAHEEVANVPARRVMPEPVFAQQADPPAPTLAMLRVAPAARGTAADSPSAATPPPAPGPGALPVPDTEQFAALNLDDIARAETAKPDLAAAEPEVAAKPESAAAMETPGPLPAAAELPPAADTKLAVLDAPPSPPVE